MKQLNENSSLEELKAGVYDNIRAIENLTRQNELINRLISQKEATKNEPVKPEPAKTSEEKPKP